MKILYIAIGTVILCAAVLIGLDAEQHNAANARDVQVMELRRLVEARIATPSERALVVRLDSAIGAAAGSHVIDSLLDAGGRR